MAKKKKTSFFNDYAKINQVQEYYKDSEESLNSFYDQDQLMGILLIRFDGYSQDKLDSELRERKKTLGRMCSLELFAAIEAKIRIDYIFRGQNELNDPFSKEIRVVYDKKKDKASLRSDILPIWRKEQPQHKTRLDELGQALDYRNWLAHGRYWQPKKHPHIIKYNYESICKLTIDILNNLDWADSA